MTRSDIKKWQAARISKALFPGTNYLVRLRRRMEQVGIPPNAPLFVLVNAAFLAMQHLGVHVHYLSCDSVGEA
jgi:hypothetical protein